MVLKAVHDKLEEIPEPFRELYTEKGGKYELTGVTGIKTQADIDRLDNSLKKERLDHKASKDALALWGDLKVDEVHAKLDRITDLEAAAQGKLDQAGIEEIVGRRVEGTIKSKLGPIERENRTLKSELEKLREENGGLKGEKRTRSIHDELRVAMVASKVLPEAYEDVLILGERVMELDEEGNVRTKDKVGVTPGLSPKDWLAEIQPKKTHFWPGTIGGDARGSNRNGGGFGGGPNPWAADSWNVTEQGKVVKAVGVEQAGKMAAAAGSRIGATKPAAKQGAKR